MPNDFLPINAADMKKRGWEQLDFICITGDAYVDHPSFGVAVISRVLEHSGFQVGIIAQPNMKNDNDFLALGKPKYGFLVTGGNIDSMVAHYTAAKKPRSEDSYSAGGKAGKRPDRAVIAYCTRLRELFKDTPIIIGGLEASLRRFSHYDYWADKIMPSILVDSTADLLIYGMGEKQIKEAAKRLSNHEALEGINGTCFLASKKNFPENAVFIPSFKEVVSDKLSYAKACKIQYEEQDTVTGKAIIEPYDNRYLVQMPPMQPLSQSELDEVYSLPFMRAYHPIYEALGGVSAIEEVEFSIIHNRGCFGGCNFCSLAFHQGRVVTSRSKKSIVNEAEELTKKPHFKGYINDIGGPTANFRSPSCEKQLKFGMCKNKKCLAPTPCESLKVDHKEYLDILREVSHIKGIKKVFIRSGIRYDYLMADKDKTFLKELIQNHISGQLKVAPEHCVDSVLDAMGKPHFDIYEEFSKQYAKINQQLGKKQFLVPYLISSHPGSTLKSAIKLAEYLNEIGYTPEQVQDFYPTPGTISTCMYYTEINPFTLKPIYVPKTAKEKAMQRALLQYRLPQNRELVLEALNIAKRYDLIGFEKKCLVKPDTVKKTIEYKVNKKTKKTKR